LISAEANGLRGLLITSRPLLVKRRCRGGAVFIIPSGGLELDCGLEDIRANFKSNDDETGGDDGDRLILLTPPVIGMLLDIFSRGLKRRGRRLFVPRWLSVKIGRRFHNFACESLPWIGTSPNCGKERLVPDVECTDIIERGGKRRQ